MTDCLVFVTATREPRNGTARFTITELAHDSTIAHDHVDWPTAWRILAEIDQPLPIEFLLRSALFVI